LAASISVLKIGLVYYGLGPVLAVS